MLEILSVLFTVFVFILVITLLCQKETYNDEISIKKRLRSKKVNIIGIYTSAIFDILLCMFTVVVAMYLLSLKQVLLLFIPAFCATSCIVIFVILVKQVLPTVIKEKQYLENEKKKEEFASCDWEYMIPAEGRTIE